MYTAKQMIVVRRDLKMRKGKIAAQAGHACVTAVLMALEREDRLRDVITEGDWISLSRWFADGTAKICVYVDSEEELLELDRKAKEMGFISALIRDAGHTEFHDVPTFTCLAFEPLYPEDVAPLTGELPLY